ncbi:MAG: SUF system Fe-S cluster assembly protein [Myxococcota bacterium]
MSSDQDSSVGPEVLDLTNAGRGARAADAPTVDGTAASDSPVDPAASGLAPAMQVRDRIVAVLKTVYDPEIPVDIYELGLVYGVDVTDDGEVHITMTLTSPMCPVAETLPPEVEEKVRGVVGVKDVVLDLVWDPPWSMDMLSDAARLELNLM